MGLLHQSHDFSLLGEERGAFRFDEDERTAALGGADLLDALVFFWPLVVGPGLDSMSPHCNRSDPALCLRSRGAGTGLEKHTFGGRLCLAHLSEA